MAGFDPPELTNQAVAQLIEIADGIKQLVLHKFVVIAQTVFVEDLVVINNDGVVHTAAESKVHGTQFFDVTHEPESPSATHFLDKGGAGKIDGCCLGAALEHGVIKVDTEAHLEAFERQQGRLLVAFLNRYLTLDADETLGCILLGNAGGLQKEHKRTGRAVHDGHFRGT